MPFLEDALGIARALKQDGAALLAKFTCCRNEGLAKTADFLPTPDVVGVKVAIPRLAAVDNTLGKLQCERKTFRRD